MMMRKAGKSIVKKGYLDGCSVDAERWTIRKRVIALNPRPGCNGGFERAGTTQGTSGRVVLDGQKL